VFELLDSGDLKAIGAALKDLADGDLLRKQLTKELREAADPMARKVQAAWKAAPSQGHATSSRARRGQPNLRALLAKATHVEARLTGEEAGARVRTDGRRMPDGMKSLPRYVEGTKPRWRYPVFGNRNVWVARQPSPRFYQAVQPDESRAVAAAERAVESVLDKIAKAR
jgi:hypothetical protein